MISERIKQIKMKAVKQMLEEYDSKYDEEAGLIYEIKEKPTSLHTNIIGKVHGLCLNREYVQLIFMTESEEKYTRAIDITEKICNLQDKNPKSRTYGLWPYYAEEGFEGVSKPDYNYAEFVGSTLIYVMNEKRELIDDVLADKICDTLKLAAYCCVKRNAGVDYTNVACMSIFTIISIAEITGDEYLFKKGKEELIHFTEYTRYNNAFNEYNSPNYVQIAGDAIAKMLMYFKDDECRKMAEELNYTLWEMLARHYSTEFNMLAPPYSRAYADIDEQQISFFVYMATDGKYGLNTGSINVYQLSDISCPKEIYHLFEENGLCEKVYYKKNNLRSREEDVTIVRDFDSPDLVLYSCINNNYLFGSFQKSDLWSQRRTLMTVWDTESKKSLKLVCLKNGQDFCSGMSYVVQDNNKAVILLGFCTDHGDTHYILDLFENGKISAESLMFKFQLGGNSQDLTFEENNGVYVLSDRDTSINIRIEKWIFDGKRSEVRIAEDGLELICFDGEEKIVDITTLKESYAVISYAVNEKPAEVMTEQKDKMVYVTENEGKHIIKGYAVPAAYDDCIRNTQVK